MIHPPKKPMPRGFDADDFMPGVSAEDAVQFGEDLESADPSSVDALVLEARSILQSLLK